MNNPRGRNFSPLLNTYNRADLAFVRGKGVWLYDSKGRKFLDLASGIAVNSLGHSHPKLVKVLTSQASKLWHTSNLYNVPNQEELASLLTKCTFGDKVFFTNSGAESIECAIKIARRFSYEKGDLARNRIISFNGSFHGRTLATISAAGSKKLLEGFGPKLQGFDTVKSFCLEAVERKITNRTCAILVEPILGEGGIVPLSCKFLKGLKKLCIKYELLLIFDEVQTGIGRTGHFLAHENCKVSPDIVALAKGLGSGIPIGACITTEKVGECMTPGSHGSTYGGNPLSCAVGIETIKQILKPNFLPSVDQKGKYLLTELNALLKKYPKQLIEIRGQGLMIGIKCAGSNLKLLEICRKEKLLLVPAASNILRILPPLVISYEEITESIKRLDRSLSQLDETT